MLTKVTHVDLVKSRKHRKHTEKESPLVLTFNSEYLVFVSVQICILLFTLLKHGFFNVNFIEA